MFGSDISKKDVDDDIEIEEEEEEEEEIDGPGLRIRGDYNFEIPEVLHTVFLHLSAKEIVQIGRVSPTFRQVATSDILWGQILENKDKYIEEGKLVSGKLAFFYDLKPKGDNLYEKFLFKFKRGYLRNIRIEKRKKRIEFQRELERRTEPYCVILFMCLMGWVSVLVPPAGILVTLIAGLYRLEYHKLEEPALEFVLKIASILDIIFGLFVTTGGLPAGCYCLLSTLTCCYGCGCCCACGVPFSMLFSCFCCCITAPNVAVWYLAGWLGRFYFAEEVGSDPELVLLLGSPAVIAGYGAAAGIYGAVTGIIHMID